MLNYFCEISAGTIVQKFRKKLIFSFSRYFILNSRMYQRRSS